MKSTVRGILNIICGAVLFALGASAQDVASQASEQSQNAVAPATTASYEISGAARSGKTPLPGVTVTAANSLTGKKISTATTFDGKFSLPGIPRGRYVVRIEFMGFAVFTQEVVLNPENPSAKVDAELILASRQQEQANSNLAAMAAAGRGFQSLAVDSALSSLSGENSGTGGPGTAGGSGANDLSALPMNGAGADAPTESVSITGAQGRTQDFGGGNEEELQQRIQEFRERGGFSGFGGGQGFGWQGGGPGGGALAIGRIGGRGFNINQPHGVLYFSNDNAGLDARPFSLDGTAGPKADYNQARFGANVGGPLNIPKIFNGGNKWFFFAGWNGSRGSSPYDAFSTVPTVDERTGNFSNATYFGGAPVQLVNRQINGVSTLIAPNMLNPLAISPAATFLLQFIPLPNIPLNALGQNFHYVTSAASNTDTVILRLVHNFGPTPAPGSGQQGAGGRGGGGGGRRRSQNNINFGLNWARSSSNIVNPFPSLAGGTGTQGLNANAGWTYGKGRATNIFRVTYNHNHVSTTNLFSNVTDVAGPPGAGIGGISNDPFDWGLPGISFTSFGGLSDPMPRRELDQTYSLSDTVSWNHGKHNWRFGGDYRRILQSFHSARNAEGSFVFTGYATSDYDPITGKALTDTGSDFADFLLGLPQQTSLQFGATSYDFRANAFDFFAQDDWRFRSNLSFNVGLRYEYNGPYTEAQDRISNLAVAPGFASAQPVVPAGAVLPPNSGNFLISSTPSLVKPDRNNFAPRIGIAWKPQKQTVVRAGYGINYNLAQYGAVIQNFAFQPPFAETATNSTDVNGLATATPLTLTNGFPKASAATVTNNFAINPNYRLGYVQIWNLDIQRELPKGVMLNVGYNGAKGTRLDTERALVGADNQPFIYESSEGNSILHAASVRVRKRMAKGLGLSGQYVFSKSIDDASSIGGGGSVVAQNPLDISADRGLSSFNQKHKFTGNWIYDLPFGENRRFAQKGAASHILGGWQWSGDFTVASGLYFTPRVLGGGLDIGRGVSGSLRADVVAGQPISISNPSTREWFNTAAFCNPEVNCPAGSPTTFGDAGRNIIEGPGQATFDMTVNKTITIKESRSLDLRFTANNVFNIVHYTSINTVVNSSSYGEVTGAASMRRVTMQARFRF